MAGSHRCGSEIIEKSIRIFLSKEVFVSRMFFQAISALGLDGFSLGGSGNLESSVLLCSLLLLQIAGICGVDLVLQDETVDTWSYFPRVFYSSTKNALLKCTRRLPNSSHIPGDIFSISKNAILVSFFPSPSLSVDCV